MQDPEILIVDDDPRHAESLCELLRAHGHRASFETRGTAGLEALKTRTIDVLILDLNIPDLSGVDILSEVNAAGIDTKTIVVSGEATVSHVTPILRLGAYDYLAKPFVAEHLLTSIGNALKRRELEHDYKLVQAEREVDNRRHEFLINASSDLIYVLDPEGQFSYINNKLKDIFDYDSRKLIGAPWSDLVAEDVRDELAWHINERRTGARATRHLELDYPDQTGATRVLELSALGLYEAPGSGDGEFSGTYGVLRDVTESRHTARALSQSQQKFYGLFMNSPDAVFIANRDDGALIEGNANFSAMLGGLATERLQNDLAVWGDARTRDRFMAGLDLSPGRYQTLLERQVGNQVRDFEITGRLLDIDGESCVIASLRDLTSEKQAQRDRLNLETQLQQASKMEAIGQLAGGIAHDFNNILASMIGYSELAESTPDLDAQIKGYLTEVITAGQRARDLISQMLTFTRANRGNVERTNIVESLDEVSRMLRAAIPKTIRIDTTFDASAGEVIIDPVQLQQIVINLLINARDAIEGNGSIRMSLHRAIGDGRCAACDAELSGDRVVLSVADTGHGIPEEVLPQIFDMFVSTREPGRGTGIGLWLVNTFVHENHGHIQISTSPQGTQFSVYLPVADDVEPESDSFDAEEPEYAPPKGQILVIDDEVSVSNFIGEVLRNAGFSVTVFNDAARALEYLLANADEIALVLTDVSMPQVTGLDIARAAKSLPDPLPVVIITGFADKADSAQLKELGVEELLEKPFRIDTLLETVRALTASAG